SPAMNMIPARLENGAGALRLHLPGDIVLPVPAERTQRYAPLAGKEVLFGIRPEHLTEPRNLDRPNIALIEAAPEVIEPMGMETMVIFSLQGTEITARVDPGVPAELGRKMPLAADLNQMHLIEPRTGQVL
ncbi:MAG: sugar ABC transporter ATP-binding protein, partial [Acetobacteraceae bacterium]|nr:sugar ABC transporter ATP-binding protein [Acetobacteraceae bacterium]